MNQKKSKTEIDPHLRKLIRDLLLSTTDTTAAIAADLGVDVTVVEIEWEQVKQDNFEQTEARHQAEATQWRDDRIRRHGRTICHDCRGELGCTPGCHSCMAYHDELRLST